MQSLLHLAFPPQCVACAAPVGADFALCGPCWRDMPFIAGLACESCGVPLPGEAPAEAVHCDDCLAIARPWRRGRAAMLYQGTARRLVLALKHGDRLDLVRPAAGWMARVAAPFVLPETVLVPVPAHRLRLWARRYNQAALLAQALARRIDRPCLPDLLTRTRRTPILDGMSREARFQTLAQAIRPAPDARARLAGRPVVLIDDVMTSGATLAAAAEACQAAGAAEVAVLVLARVAKTPHLPISE